MRETALDTPRLPGRVRQLTDAYLDLAHAEATRLLLAILAHPGVLAAQLSADELTDLSVKVREYGDLRVRQVRVLDAAIAVEADAIHRR